MRLWLENLFNCHYNNLTMALFSFPNIIYFLLCSKICFHAIHPESQCPFRGRKEKTLSDVRSSRGFLRKRSCRHDCSWGRVFIMGFYSRVFPAHINHACQWQSAAVICSDILLLWSYNTVNISFLVFIFLQTGLSVPPLCSSVFRLYWKTIDIRYYCSVNFIISRGCDFSCSAALFY